MAAPKRFLIPSLSEMDNENDNKTDTNQGSLFKRHKSARDLNATNVSSEESTANISSRPTTKSKNGKDSSGAYTSNSNNNKDICGPSTNQQASSTSSNNTTSSLATNSEKSVHSNSNEVSKSSVPSKPGSSNSLIVNPRQRGNPILKSVRSVPWEYGNIVPDYVMGPSNCALFLSLRYHQLHPNYIHDRLKALGQSYELRVMLVQVDVKEPHHLLKGLAKICLLADCTLILAFSTEEAGRYLETYKVFENKPAEAIMERTENNYMSKFVDCLTRVKSVNKTDCATLMTAFGSLSNIMEATEDELCLCPGFGPQKAKRLRGIFQEPFLRSLSKDQGIQEKDFEADGT